MSKAKPFSLLLVQTGSTEWDRQNRIGGALDMPLADEAESPAATAVVKPTQVLCGPDECSQASAAAFGEAQGAKVRKIDRLADVGMGLWEGLTHEQVEERFPKAFKQWMDRPDSISAPSGESLADAEERLIGEIRLAASKLRGENPVLMVVLRPMAYALVRGRLLGRSPAELWDVLESAPEGVETFEVMPGAFAPSPKKISA